MGPEALQSLMDVLGLDAAGLARRLGGESQHYERLRRKGRLPFPVWDALQRLAYREGYAWNPRANTWTKEGGSGTRSPLRAAAGRA